MATAKMMNGITMAGAGVGGLGSLTLADDLTTVTIYAVAGHSAPPPPEVAAAMTRLLTASWSLFLMLLSAIGARYLAPLLMALAPRPIDEPPSPEPTPTEKGD